MKTTEKQRAAVRRWNAAHRDELRAYKREWGKRNRGRYAQQEKTWRAANKQRLDRARLARQCRTVYGITLADYERKFTAQGGCCAICRRPQSEFKKRFGVDHNHTTGKIRALLCARCNTGLGLFLEDPDLLMAAIEYLAEWA